MNVDKHKPLCKVYNTYHYVLHYSYSEQSVYYDSDSAKKDKDKKSRRHNTNQAEGQNHEKQQIWGKIT